MAAANQHHLLPTTQPASSTAKNNNKRGLAGFSIDDILSHKTAQAMQVQQQLQAAAQQQLHAAKKQRLMIDVEGDVDTDENDLEDDEDMDEEDDDLLILDDDVAKDLEDFEIDEGGEKKVAKALESLLRR